MNPRSTNGVLTEVYRERVAQDDRWGEQSHIHLFGKTADDAADSRATFTRLQAAYKELNEKAVPKGELDWTGIFLEEVYEALSEEDPERLRGELIQAAAVAVAWIEDIDRKAGRVSEG